MLESALQTKVLAYLRGRGGWWVNCTPSAYSRAGIPDVIGCYNSFFVAIELKAPGKYKEPERGLTAAQVKAKREIEAADGWYLCTDSLEAVMEYMDNVF